MAEENTEDLSMEDILSSIKDILTEDEQAQTPAAESDVAPSAQPLAATPVEQSVEDILDLSPSMRIEEEIANPADEINLDDELNDISPDLDMAAGNETTAPSAEFSPEDILNSLPSLEEDKDLQSDPFDLAAEPVEEISDEEEVLETASADSAWDWDKGDDDGSEPFIQADAPAEDENALPTANFEIAESEVAFEDEPETIEENPLPELVATSEPEPEFEIAPQPEQPVEEPVAETLPLEEPKTDSNAVDASASIINNFAKMFASEGANESKKALTIDLPAEPVVSLGNAAATIEEVVAKVIRSIIGEEVSENWRKSADYDTLAREEIKAQTKQWLDKNLPALVEKIVKQEIERVMAKVGSQD